MDPIFLRRYRLAILRVPKPTSKPEPFLARFANQFTRPRTTTSKLTAVQSTTNQNYRLLACN